MYTQERKESKYNTKDNHQITRDKSKNGDRGKKRTTENYRNYLQIISKMTICTYPQIITLNVNGPNAPIKRQSG